MEKKIKVVHITHDLDLGGLQRVIINICRTIDRSKFDVSILCLRKLGCFLPEVEKLGIPVTLLPKKGQGTDYFLFLKVAEYLRKEKPDVIHTHNTQPFVDGTLGAILSGVKKIIHTDHARSFPDKRRYMFAEWFVSHFTYKVIGVSEHTSENLIKYEHISKSKVMTIPNGIDPQPYQIKIDKEAKRSELGISQSSIVLGVAVRLSEQKGLSYLLKTMPDILKVKPDVSLVIAGDGPLRDELRVLAENLGISKNVYFLGLRTDTVELLRIFDIYVMPSIWEGLPMILLEAMAAECPIVSTDVGGITTAIENNVNGLLVKPASQEEIKNAIVYLIENPELRKTFANNALQRFNNEFTARCMTEQYENLYRCNSRLRKAVRI